MISFLFRKGEDLSNLERRQLEKEIGKMIEDFLSIKYQKKEKGERRFNLSYLYKEKEDNEKEKGEGEKKTMEEDEAKRIVESMTDSITRNDTL